MTFFGTMRVVLRHSLFFVGSLKNLRRVRRSPKLPKLPKLLNLPLLLLLLSALSSKVNHPEILTGSIFATREYFNENKLSFDRKRCRGSHRCKRLQKNDQKPKLIQLYMNHTSREHPIFSTIYIGLCTGLHKRYCLNLFRFNISDIHFYTLSIFV